MKREQAYRKHLSVLFLLIVSSLFVVQFVGAQESVDPTGAGQLVNSFGRGTLDFFASAFGLEEGADNPLNMLTYFFMAIVLYSLISISLETAGIFEKNTLPYFLTTIGVTVLVIIALPADFYTVILPSYGALGGALLTILPFLIIFMFSIRIKKVMPAQFIWILFAFYYFAFYFLSASQPGNTSAQSIIYLLAGLVGLIMIFLMSPIRKYFRAQGTKDEGNKIISGGELIAAKQKADKTVGESYSDVGADT